MLKWSPSHVAMTNQLPSNQIRQHCSAVWRTSANVEAGDAVNLCVCRISSESPMLRAIRRRVGGTQHNTFRLIKEPYCKLSDRPLSAHCKDRREPPKVAVRKAYPEVYFQIELLTKRRSMEDFQLPFPAYDPTKRPPVQRF